MAEGPAGTVDQLLAGLQRSPTVERRGRLVEILGTTLKVTGIAPRIGDACEVIEPSTGRIVPVEVVGIAGQATILTPLADVRGLSVDAEVIVRSGEESVPWGDGLLGRVLDGRGRPIDGKGELPVDLKRRPLHAPAPQPMERALIDAPLPTGVRAIDTLLTLGRGQRLGVFAAAGGGKSTLLGMLARFAQADVIVIALIGERGREVREFIEDSLGEAGLARAVIVCATSDRAAMERVRAAHHATAIAEGFRSEGLNVLLLMDSVTRFARALREIGLAAGEPPVRRGFPPSVFAELPRLFERAGNDAIGSITGIYTVLLEDEEGDDPIGEEVRSILDGHVILSRKLGAAGHYPAIDVLASLSRLFPRLAEPAHRDAATRVRALLAKHAEIEFLVQVGEYRTGADPLADRAIAAKSEIDSLLRQDANRPEDFQTSLMLLRGVAG
ncbi:FliI/YscN family ATPase [Sphingomonas psychrotolerans]|uniref:Flagellum-specific ATP synthase FliI n=1 Tax=Sphingomonas psychrotolerans TaxID=1327635 RepID=A0A2K8MD91_9SPHN|nr:FliI/YscN family ATPase [Sphingomonas psychrotolerans]ATY31860.1 flagellum-specific ATP synthase FliI [Sphingomonas psychrotolerans]